MPSVEDIVNEALRDAGIPKRIGNIYQGGIATTALEIYGQTRDELLRSQDCPFARRANVALQLLKGPPPNGGYNPAQPWANTYAPPGFLFEYAYPADALEIRAIVRPPGLWPDRDPRPALFSVENDGTLGTNSSNQVIVLSTSAPLLVNGAPVVLSPPPATIAANGLRVVLTNVFSALTTYKARVIDPALWDVLFTRSLIKGLAEKFVADPAMKQAEEKSLVMTAAVADRHRG